MNRTCVFDTFHQKKVKSFVVRWLKWKNFQRKQSLPEDIRSKIWNLRSWSKVSRCWREYSSLFWAKYIKALTKWKELKFSLCIYTICKISSLDRRACFKRSRSFPKPILYVKIGFSLVKDRFKNRCILLNWLQRNMRVIMALECAWFVVTCC